MLSRSAGVDAPGRAGGALARRGVRAAAARDDDEPFVFGGADVYRRRCRCDRCYLTVVERQYTGDTIFPGSRRDWTLTETESHPESEPPYRFETWDRRRT